MEVGETYQHHEHIYIVLGENEAKPIAHYCHASEGWVLMLNAGGRYPIPDGVTGITQAPMTNEETMARYLLERG